jgi:cellulose synthase (UDP-forming)
MVTFLYWFADADHMGYAPIFWLLTFALAFKLLKMLHEWYHYWSPSVPVAPKVTRQWTVDVLTTACPGEPREMIIRTLRAMQAIRYPHTSYLCDEGNDPELKQVCDELEIIHVTRTEKVNAKAGNINNALKQAKGEICVVLDPDHVPIPEFLDRVLPYFEDESIGYVQCVQGYGNQGESFVARGAAEQTYHFYGPMMMCMNTYGTAQAIGANCTFRREALDSIGGHAAGLSEDMHTAMQLHAKGWRSVYIPELLTRGLVPATLSSYYKQQLKWSRGTFDLLFNVFPKLCRKFTWRQKLHYATLPFYFLYGLVNLIDISVPLVALSAAEVPWEVDLSRFGVFFITLCGFSLLVRMYAQRWLLEKHEHGFHLYGGVLRTATWWIFLIGLLYTILRIKVLYIPTPKEGEPENCVRLCVPNIVVIAVCCLLVPYGLSLDYTPYSLAMAGYAALTAGILGVAVIASQQKALAGLYGFGRRFPAVWLAVVSVAGYTRKFQQTAYGLLRNASAVVIIAVSILFLSYSTIDEYGEDAMFPEKELGGFYFGRDAGSCRDLFNSVGIKSSVSAFTRSWDPASPVFISGIPAGENEIPFLTWAMPGSADSLFSQITGGKHDGYLKDAAAWLRSYRDPVFISFTAEPEQINRVGAERFVLSWQYLYTFFNSLGISNVTWVWTPSSPGESACYPGEKFVDWIGVRCIAETGNFSSFYGPFRQQFGKFRKPVMLTALSFPSGPGQAEWFGDVLRLIKREFREIHGAIITEPQGSILTTETKQLLASELKGTSSVSNLRIHSEADTAYRSRFMKGSPGAFTLQVNGKPWYLRGVAYNTAHDWRDGNMPLTRRQVESDFEKIKAMGANIVRRYGTGIYDRNVLNIASEYDLKVLFGFWFDPKVDYFADEERVNEYLAEVEKKVMEYRDHSAILAWSVGNESWGLLKHRYAKPYLTVVRRAYLQMLERMARRIHELDPSRPVFSCIEHEEYQIAGEFVAFRDEVPSVDAMGVNSYYNEQINKVNHIAWQFDSIRPYFVSEFGPYGYWDPKYNRAKHGSVIEQTDREKADWYTYQWTHYIDAFRGNNIGGFAYCWHDRMEGSYTWFGLTDFRGRLKPSYFALKSQWTKCAPIDIPEYAIVGPESVSGGNTYTYRVTAERPCANVKYEWMLLKSEYLDRVGEIEVLSDGVSARVTIPESPSNYRLYVHVVNEETGWVSTSSIPARVERILQ